MARLRRVADRGTIRSTRFTARPVHVHAPLLLRGGVPGDHRIDGPCRDADEQPWRGKTLPPGGPVRLVDLGAVEDPYPVALGLEDPPDHSPAEGRMIDIPVTRHEDDVELVPATQRHLSSRPGQEARQVLVVLVGLVGLGHDRPVSGARRRDALRVDSTQRGDPPRNRLVSGGRATPDQRGGAPRGARLASEAAVTAAVALVDLAATGGALTCEEARLLGLLGLAVANLELHEEVWSAERGQENRRQEPPGGDMKGPKKQGP